MTPEQTTTARKLVALPGFRWHEGMALAFASPSPHRLCIVTRSGRRGHIAVPAGATPDLTHDANVGPLLSWLREVLPDGWSVNVECLDDGFEVTCGPWLVPLLATGQNVCEIEHHLPHALALALVAVLGGSDV